MKYYCLALAVLLFCGCDKETAISKIDCALLKQGLLDYNYTLVSRSLGSLVNKTYSEENLNQIANAVTKSCSIHNPFFCYDCVYTNPAQSEMALSFLDNAGDTILRVIDFMPSPDNKIKIVNVHG